MLWQTTALAFIVLLLVVGGMSLGVILSGRPIKGSCGGLSALSGGAHCGVCGRDRRDSSESDCGQQSPASRA